MVGRGAMTDHATTRVHRLRRMTGRDPHESHRGATPLELLFDLTFVVAFALAGNEAAHLVAEGHVGAAVAGFAFSMFAVCWAWINVTWFSSAFDTDDWFFRALTMVQMVGVLVLALGIAPVFHSIDAGEPLDNGVLVAGYIIMRVALVAQWLRAARQDPEHRRAALTFAVLVLVAQAGWTVLAILEVDALPLLAAMTALYLLELAGPVLAERRAGGTPWHAHHVAERYGLLLIIALGEVILGTMAAVSAVVGHVGWSVDAIVLVVAGTGLTFGLWWCYFIVPSGAVLHRHRGRSFPWGYGHILVFSSVAAMGVGLHVAAYVIEGEARGGAAVAVLAIAIPVATFAVVYFALYALLVRALDPLHLALLAGMLAALALGVGMALSGASIAAALVPITLAPFVVVVGYETIGHRHRADVLSRSLG
jgi:low temperature requirement protein LtrA